MEEFNKGNITVDELQWIVADVNGYNGSLEEYEYYDMEYTFNELLSGLEPLEIARMINFGDFNYNHDYWTFNGYGNIESIDEYELKEILIDDYEYILETALDAHDNNYIDLNDHIDYDTIIDTEKNNA